MTYNTGKTDITQIKTGFISHGGPAVPVIRASSGVLSTGLRESLHSSVESFKCVKGLPSLLNNNHCELGQLFTFISVHRRRFAHFGSVIISWELLGLVCSKITGFFLTYLYIL